MTIVEFKDGLDKLIKFYGDNTRLNDFQQEVWFERLQYMTMYRFEKIINKIFETSKYMPKLCEILQINLDMVHKSERAEVVRVKCDICQGLGLIPYFVLRKDGSKNIKYQYFAKCSCLNGNEYDYDGTKIQEKRNRSDNYIPDFDELGLVEGHITILD